MIDGLILAGGHSVRMGQSKPDLQVAGNTLLGHQMLMMRSDVMHLFVAGNGLHKELAMVDAIFLDDAYPGQEGPLSGVAAALAASSAELLWIMGCDNYGFTPQLLAALQECLRDSGADIAYLQQNGRDHPLLAVWRTKVKTALLDYLQVGGRSVFKWYANQSTVAVCMPALPGQFCNINTPDDYQALLDAVC